MKSLDPRHECGSWASRFRGARVCGFRGFVVLQVGGSGV